MQTKVFNIETDDENEVMFKCAQLIKDGGTVAFPTETVYGLGANALDGQAVSKIFKAKGRPSDNPLIVHVSAIEEVRQLVKEIPPEAKALMDIFWPGPLTIILEKSDIIPPEVSANLDTVAVRMPAHPVALSLIKAAGVPIAAPSANISGKPSPTKGEHVVEDLVGRIDAIILGDDCKVGVESTVLDMSGDVPTILRPGGVTREQLETVLGVVMIDPALEEGLHIEAKPKSPGMKYTHYAPRAEVVIVKGSRDLVIDKIKDMIRENKEKGKEVGLLCFDDDCLKFEGVILKSMGERQRLDKVASNIFGLLREFDKTNVDIIIAEAVEEREIGQAIMNRLIKAAGYKVVYA